MIQGKFYMPNSQQCSIRFMKDILKGKKDVSSRVLTSQLIWNKNLLWIDVPKLDWVKIVDVYQSALRMMPELIKYFPDYSDEEDEYHPQKDYFWNVYYTLDPENALHMLNWLKSWHAQGKLKDDESIEIR